MPKLTFPGHKYLGPGNPLSNGQPVDKDDEIAAVHDLYYEKAETKEDVFRADKCAICEFLKDAKQNKNWHSLIGAAGLCAKHAAERALGRTLYPFNLPREDRPSKRHEESAAEILGKSEDIDDNEI